MCLRNSKRIALEAGKTDAHFNKMSVHLKSKETEFG